jgi:hypothetical protein
MARRKRSGDSVADRDIGEDFLNRVHDSQLLAVINKLYKREYGYSARKFLVTSVPRVQAERILKTLEQAPPSITKMFKRRLKGKYRKDRWTPKIPFPAVRKEGDRRWFVEEESKSGGFKVDFTKLAAEGRLLYTTMNPAEFLNYAYGGELVEERSDDRVPTTESKVKKKEKKMKKDEPLDTPYLKLDLIRCRFVLHDGRHRVVAADERGIKEIPVMIEHQVPRRKGELSCLRNRNLWKKEDVPSPNLRARSRV